MAGASNAPAVGAQVRGRIRYLGLYGALVDIGTGQDALLHISQLAAGDKRKFDEVVQPECEITAWVLKQRADGYVALTLEEPPAVPWHSIRRGNTYTGTVTRIEQFGLFVDIGAERPGMVHISELADDYVRSPEDVAAVGQTVEVRVIKKNGRPRQIDLSMKSAEEELETPIDDEEDAAPTAMAQAFQRAMQGDGKSRDNHRQSRSSSRHRRQQEEILARTLRNTRA